MPPQPILHPCAIAAHAYRVVVLYGGYGWTVSESKQEREEEEERGITVHTKIPYAAIGLQLGLGNFRRRAWRISRSTRTVMAYFKIDE